ncbi:MAG: ABC transporter ATP-binding protein [Ancrocorticia sp.]
MSAAMDGARHGAARGALEVRSVSKSFGSKRVLDRVSLTIHPGEIVALVGPSGSGKSTLLNVLIGALEPDHGEILVDGEPIPERGRPFAYMPQRDVLLPWRTILDNAGIGLEVAGMPRAEARERVRALVEQFGLAGTEMQYPRQLSGGMRQRVSFLRTVVQDRPILLLDEPFGALDAITRDELQRWLLGIWAENSWSILLITHDIREAVRLADRVLVLPSMPGPLIDGVEVSRDIPRTTGFLTDPRVPPLEAALQSRLELAAGS